MRLASSLALIAALALAAPLAAAPAQAAGIGIVLLHARGSWPGQFDNIVPKLKAAGYQVLAPELCWSVHRQYSTLLDKCQDDIDVAIDGLKGGGADRIVLAGSDVGAMDAMYYASTHPGIAGVVLWEPRANIRPIGDADLTTALAMAKAGDGDKKGNFNEGRLYVTANALLSFEGPYSPFADTGPLLAKVPAPVLWMAAVDDVGPRDPTERYSYAKPNALNTLMWSRTDMFSMIDVSIDQVLGWLDKLNTATKPAAK